MSRNYNVRKYIKRVYSGLPNKKRVAGQLKRHYGESCVSRNYIWGPHPKLANHVPEETGATTSTPLETISSGPSKTLRTYARPTPIMRKEADTAYGHQNESVAKTIFMETRNKFVRPAGLFIDEEYGFLGASPDGVIEEEEAIVEIKCFPSLARSAQSIESAAKEKKCFCLCYVADTLHMNKKHDYFYQVQGQLRVTKMNKCYFIGYISPMHPITVVEVYRDEEFISALVTKLKVFFENCILPEIILRRIPKNAKCLEPTKASKNVN